MISHLIEIGFTTLHLAAVYLLYRNRGNESGLGLILLTLGVVCLNFERLHEVSNVPASTFFGFIVGPCTFLTLSTCFLLVRIAVDASKRAIRLRTKAANRKDKNR